MSNLLQPIRLSMRTFAAISPLAFSLSLAVLLVCAAAKVSLGQADDAAADTQAQSTENQTRVPKQTRPHDANSAVAWEYAPYRVKVWIVDDDSFVLRSWQSRIEARVVRDAILDEYNSWKVECERAQPAWRSRIRLEWDNGLDALSLLLVHDESLAGYDKLIAIRVGQSASGYAIDGRELDLSTRQWSRLTELSASELELVPERVYAAVRSSFMPITRIERVANEVVYVRTRATALSRKLQANEAGQLQETPNLESPIRVSDKDVLMPVVRREARDSDEFTADIVPWTYLTIDEQQGSTLKCMTHTSQFAPLSGRSGSSIKKFALVVRPHPRPTSLTVTAQESKTHAPISGLEIYHCRAEELSNKDYKLMGKTDWRGEILVEPEPDGAIRYVIIRNGQLATKRPILPGHYDSLTTAVPSDRARVFAEGVLAALRNEIVELAALRATVKHRVQVALEKQEFERAKKIYDEEYLKIKSHRQVVLRLTDVRERLLNRRDADQRQRQRIDSMFKAMEATLAQIQGQNREGKSIEDDVSLESRVLNKISTPPELPDIIEQPIPEGEQPLPPNKPVEQEPPPQAPADENPAQPQATQTPANDSQEFD